MIRTPATQSHDFSVDFVALRYLTNRQVRSEHRTKVIGNFMLIADISNPVAHDPRATGLIPKF